MSEVSTMQGKRGLAAADLLDTSSLSGDSSHQQGPKRSCLQEADSTCSKGGRVPGTHGAAAGQAEGADPEHVEAAAAAAVAAAIAAAATAVEAATAEAAAAAAAAAIAEATGTAGASAGTTAPSLTPQQARVVAKWEERWQQLGLHHKHGPRCSAPAVLSSSWPPGVVRVSVRALPPKDLRESVVPDDWVPKREDHYFLAPEGRHENGLNKLRVSCPHLDWGQQQPDERAGTRTAAAAANARPKQPRRSASTDAQQPPHVVAQGIRGGSAAAAPEDTAAEVAGAGGRSEPRTSSPQQQQGGSNAAERDGVAAEEAAASRQAKEVAGPSGASSDPVDQLLGVTQHLAHAYETLEALAACGQQIAEGSARGQVRALQGMLEIHKAELRSSAAAVRLKADMFRKLADAYDAIHKQLQ